MRNPLFPLWPIIAAATLSACSGGGSGGGNGGGQQTGNQAPVFTSAGTPSVAENTSGVFYTATATDADGDSLSFTISGGADAGLLQISNAGALRFNTPPDFENPADANGDNVYQIQITANDGQATTMFSLSITVTDSGNDGFTVRRVATGFNQPLYLTAIPDGSGRVFVVEKQGRIRILNPDTGGIDPTLFLDVSGEVSTDSERGLLGMAVAPDFASTGTFYVYLTNSAGNSELRRYSTLAADPDRADPATADIILTIAQPDDNHNGGWIDFGPDGLLYVGVGDGGGGGDPGDNAQNTNTLLGSLLRLDVSGDDFPGDPLRDYRIPATNPFTSGGGAPEIWAYGLRNPFRNSFDSATGNLFIADVGQGAIEEIDLMRPDDGGANFGWNILEGTQTFEGGSTAGLTPPIAEYPHGSGQFQGNSVTGGYVYRGPVEALRGHYFFADFVSNNVWSIPVSSIMLGQTIANTQFTNRNADFTPDAGTIGSIASFGLDAAGNLYIVDLGGEIFRVEATS